MDVLARVHREPDAGGAGQLSGLAELFPVYGSPVVGESRVGGKGDQALAHPEKADVVGGVPADDLFQSGYVLPGLESFSFSTFCRFASRKVRLVPAGIVRFCVGYPKRIMCPVYNSRRLEGCVHTSSTGA